LETCIAREDKFLQGIDERAEEKNGKHETYDKMKNNRS
jgi:hypothetical protein